MKKRILILVLAGMFCLAGCGQDTENPPKDPVIQDEQKDPEDNEDPDEDGDGEIVQNLDEQDGQGTEDGQEDGQTDVESVTIHVYSSNDDATAFQSTEVTVGSLSPEAVLQALVDQGAIPADVRINSLEQTTADGIGTLMIDFNGAFASYVSSMGSAGEYYAMGSVCNTFLDAYGCEQVKITVDGATLETGHTDYPGYMGMYS